MAKLKFKAISIGFVTYTIGFLVTGVLFLLTVTPWMYQYMSSPSELEAKRTAIMQNPVSGIVLVAIGWLWLCIGGITAGYLAKDHEIVNSLSVGLISIVIDALFHVLVSSPIPIWLDLLFFAITIPTAVFGGFLSQRYSGRVKSIESRLRGTKLGLGIIIASYIFYLYLTGSKIYYMGGSEGEIVGSGIIAVILVGLIYRWNIARTGLLILTGFSVFAFGSFLIRDVLKDNWESAIFVGFLPLMFNIWVFFYLRKPSVKELFHPIIGEKAVSGIARGNRK